MKNLLMCFGLGAAVFFIAGCQVFEDQTPESISFRMAGTPGDTVMIIYSKQFIAGVDEGGVTRVEVFGADTVFHILPIDTIVDVRLERRIFLQAETSSAEASGVSVQVDVNDRNIFDRAGDLFPDLPWRFLYQFNTVFTDDVEVII